MNHNMDEKTLDLLCDRAATGLDEEERRDLSNKIGDENEEMYATSFELSAAAIALAELGIDEKMPAHLESRILADAERYFAELTEGSPQPVPREIVLGSTARPRLSFLSWLGWAAAAAACIALAFNVYNTPNTTDLANANIRPTPDALTIAQQRERLLASATDLTKAVWTKGNVPESANIEGDVVWSDAKQAGYMRLKGLPVNDANETAYQLWIFDETQSEKTPIDGGVFNVTSDGEVIIPITAKLAARNPKAFAITIEKPGGVVVSDRSKVAGLAPVKPGQA